MESDGKNTCDGKLEEKMKKEEVVGLKGSHVAHSSNSPDTITTCCYYCKCNTLYTWEGVSSTIN
jgi:hypothetical protein